MRSLNRVELLGNLGGDPKIMDRSGGRLASLAVATSYGVKKNDGSWDNHTTWHNVVTFNDKLVSDIADNLFKGDMVFLTGAIQKRKYTDKDGRERESTDVVVGPYDAFVIIPKGDKPSRRPEAQSSAQEELDDEIPF